MRQLGMFDTQGEKDNSVQAAKKNGNSNGDVEQQKPARSNITAKARRQAKRRATASQLMHLIKQQEYRCALCGCEITPETASLDHIVPASHGGTDDIGNLQWLHADVNKAKGTLGNQAFIALCRKVAQYQS